MTLRAGGAARHLGYVVLAVAMSAACSRSPSPTRPAEEAAPPAAQERRDPAVADPAGAGDGQDASMEPLANPPPVLPRENDEDDVIPAPPPGEKVPPEERNPMPPPEEVPPEMAPPEMLE